MNIRATGNVTGQPATTCPFPVLTRPSQRFALRIRLASRRRASALLVVMWALIVLSVAVFAWAKWIHQEVGLYKESNLGIDARAMAYSGIAAALHPLVNRGTPILERQFGEDRGYSVKMVSEGGKLNVRFWLEGEDPQKIDLFKRWLEQRGLTFQEREVFVDCLLDYIDQDNNNHLNGIEDSGDYHAANRPLENLEEIAKVPGSAPLLKSPGWKDTLTLYSQGPIDLLSAEPEILRLLPGFNDTRIQLLLNYRRGKDGIEGTADDPQVRSFNEVLKQYLGFSDLQIKALNGFVTVNDKMMHITSRGKVGNVIRQVEVIAQKQGNSPAIKSWKE